MTLLSERHDLFRERVPVVRIRPELVEPLQKIERAHMESALILCGGDVVLAARRLGIGKTTLYRKIAEFRAEDREA